MDSIARQFNQIVNRLVTRLEKKARSDVDIANLDRLRKRISLFKSCMGVTALISECYPYFAKFSDRIITRDEAFFMSLDIRQEYLQQKGHIDPQDEFMFSLTDSIRNHYNRARVDERDAVYSEVKEMHDLCLQFRLAQLG